MKLREAKRKITNFFARTTTSNKEPTFLQRIPQEFEKMNEFLLKHVSTLKDIDARSMFASEKSPYVQSSKKILLMFRKVRFSKMW